MLVGDRHDAIDELIADCNVNPYVRWQAVNALLFQIRDGSLTRDAAIERLSDHLQRAIENADEVAEGIVIRLAYLGAEAKLPLMEMAFEKQLVNPGMITLDSVRKKAARGDEIFAESIANLPDNDGLVSRLSHWGSFQAYGHDDHHDHEDQRSDEPLFEGSPVAHFDQSLGDVEFVSENVTKTETTIRNQGDRIGRNQRCPCGSGKKYKKCCGRKSGRSS